MSLAKPKTRESIVIMETTKLDRSSLPENELFDCAIANLLPLEIGHLTALLITERKTD